MIYGECEVTVERFRRLHSVIQLTDMKIVFMKS